MSGIDGYVLPSYITSKEDIREDRSNIILYRKSFENVAKSFAYMHLKYEGVRSILISVDEIEKETAEPNFKIPYRGWDDYNNKKNHPFIKKYDISLSKKIIHNLLNISKKENILSVLLIGNAGVIPPSYYFNLNYLPFSNKQGDVKFKNEWISSDILYASPDLDLKLNWAVGRISVKNPEEGRKIVAKYQKWYEDRNVVSEKGMIFFGGDTFLDKSYDGELAFLAFQNSNALVYPVKKYFQSHNKFSGYHLIRSFKYDSASLFLIFSHGLGDGFQLEHDFVYSRDILKVPYKKGLPLLLSPSCLGAGFDYDLMKVPHYRSEVSIGEAVLLSAGVGIGYIGASQMTLSKVTSGVHQGFVDSVSLKAMPQFLLEFFKAHNSGSTRIADILIKAYSEFGNTVEIVDDKSLSSIVLFTLIGDPVMSLPKSTPLTSNNNFKGLNLISKPNVFANNIPVFNKKERIKFEVPNINGVNKILISVRDLKKGRTLHAPKWYVPGDIIEIIPKRYSTYLIDSELKNGLLSRQFFKVGSKKSRDSGIKYKNTIIFK